VVVSDFCTPRFYKDARAVAGAKYDHKGALTQPRRVAQGGYMSWYDPRTHHLWRVMQVGERPQYDDLGEYPDMQRVVEAVQVRVPIGFFGRTARDG
jgi:hypothetical protein